MLNSSPLGGKSKGGIGQNERPDLSLEVSVPAEALGLGLGPCIPESCCMPGIGFQACLSFSSRRGIAMRWEGEPSSPAEILAAWQPAGGSWIPLGDTTDALCFHVVSV